MGIGDFCTTNNNTVFSRNNAVLENFKGKCKVKEIYFDYDSIPHIISGKIESEINGLCWDCILERTTSDGIDTIKKYHIDISVVKETNELNYKKLLENITKIPTSTISEIAINMVLDYICDICTNYTYCQELEYVYLSVDGMPNMSKIFEQQRRKYNNEFKSYMQKNIYNDYKSSLSEQRKLYETNKFSFYRNVILPQIGKSGNIIERLQSVEFFNRLKEHCPNLLEIEINHRSIPGEGEKKIMEKIVERNNQSNYLICSPDSDLVMISIILSTILKKSNLYVIKTNRGNYDCYDINIVLDNIMQEISGYINPVHKLDKLCICRDIAFIMSLFGNDFIPKLYTINIKIHQKFLFQSYAQIIEKLKDANGRINYLVTHDNIYEFDWNFLINFINLIAESEHFLYIDVYIKQNYNINHLIPYMIKPTIGETLHMFIKAINQKIFNNMKRYKLSDNVVKQMIIQSTTKELLIFFGVDRDIAGSCINKKIRENIVDNDISGIVGYNDTITFLKFFMASHNLGILDTSLELVECVKNIFDTFIINKKYYLLKLKSKNVDIESEYIVDKINCSLPRTDMEITDYDREIFKLSRKLPPYNMIYNYNPSSDHIGRINILYQNSNDSPKYDIIQNTAVQSSDEYIRKYFNMVNCTNNKSEKSEKLRITQDYVTGFYWVMNFYTNSNSAQENIKYVSTWAYQYSHSPTLHMLSDYFTEIKKYIDRKLGREIYRYQNNNNDIVGLYMKNQAKHIFSLQDGLIFVERDKFINTDEYWMFIHPVKSEDDTRLSSGYKKFRENNDIFPDIKEIANLIYSSSRNRSVFESPYNINGDFNLGLIMRLSLKKYVELLSEYNKSIINKNKSVESIEYVKPIINKG